jgi:hypothetical protein
LDQEFNSIDVQKEAGHAVLSAQRPEDWIQVVDDYGGADFSSGNTDYPAFERLTLPNLPLHIIQPGTIAKLASLPMTIIASTLIGASNTGLLGSLL